MDRRLVWSAFNPHIDLLHHKQENYQKVIQHQQTIRPRKVQHFQDVLNEKLTGNLLLVAICLKRWMQFKDVITPIAITVLELKTWVHQDWFDENHKTISAALQAKN